jgi:hypothetical protein
MRVYWNNPEKAVPNIVQAGEAGRRISSGSGPGLRGPQDFVSRQTGGLLIAIFVGIGLVYKEIQRRTIYTLLAKPISRGEFLVGKYLGLMLTLLLDADSLGHVHPRVYIIGHFSYDLWVYAEMSENIVLK